MTSKKTRHLQQRESRVGRPTTKQAGVIDKTILAAATKLFLSNGYVTTSMEAIALFARVSKRTLYLRYATKEALMTAVVADRVSTWSATARIGNENPAGDLKARLTRDAEIVMRSLGSDEIRDFDRLVRGTAPLFPELARAFYELGYRYSLEFLAAEIANGTHNDAAPARHPERVAQQLLSMIIGWRRTEEMVREVTAKEAAEFARNAVEVLFGGRKYW